MADPEKVNGLYEKLRVFNKKRGYFLNQDTEFAKALVNSLVVNEERYGYQACPCRLATGVRTDDLDIICPCDYRDSDILDYGACYCGLYVSHSISEGKQELKPIPERR
jgi:ferredoxin-thioredoxin reductase catalytic chain